ncbi:hypothetical protein KVP09_04295 [Alcaligenaceae bacterium CGII-47]|nr:hypothetical protein [Alcaligenaceae bacterium CGII-47]
MTVSDFDFEGGLAACASGDQSALQALYEHEAPTMMALACSLMDEDSEAQTLLRETFILIWRNAAGYSPALGTARAWIYSILRYRAQMRIQRIADKTAGERHEITTVLDPHALSTGIMCALDHLPDMPRKAIVLAYCKGLNYAQIAHCIQTSPESLRTQTLDALDDARAVMEAT